MPVREEGQGPAAHARGEAKVDKDGREAVLVHVVEEALDVKHEGSTVEPAAVGDVDIVQEGEAGVEGAGKGAGAKLGGGDEAVGIDVIEEALGDGLLKEFAEALQERNRAVVLSRRVVVAARLGNDNDQCSLPGGRVVSDPNTCVGEGCKVVLGRRPSHLEDAPGLAREARGRRVGGLLEVALQFVRGEGVELACGTRGGIVGLVEAHVAWIVNKEAGRKEGGNAFSVKDQRAVGVPERRDRGGLPAMAPLGNIPDVGGGDSAVGPGALGRSGDAAEGTKGVVTGGVRSVAEQLGREGALVRPPGVGVSTGGAAAFHCHGAGVVDGALQGGSGCVDGGRGEEVLNGPQGGKDGVKDGVPSVRGIVVHGRVEGAKQGGGGGSKGVGRVPPDAHAAVVRSQGGLPVERGGGKVAGVVSRKVVPG